MTELHDPDYCQGAYRFNPEQKLMDEVLRCLQSLQPGDHLTASQVAQYVGLGEWQTRVVLMALKQRGLAVSYVEYHPPRGGIRRPKRQARWNAASRPKDEWRAPPAEADERPSR